MAKAARQDAARFYVMTVHRNHVRTQIYISVGGDHFRTGQSWVVPCASWPIHTERNVGMVKKDKAMLASSITIVCRPRAASLQMDFGTTFAKNSSKLPKSGL